MMENYHEVSNHMLSIRLEALEKNIYYLNKTLEVLIEKLSELKTQEQIDDIRV